MPPKSKYADRREEIRLLYQAGSSVKQIARQLGIGRGVIQWFCKDIMRPGWIAIRMRRPRTSRQPSACRVAARTLMKRLLGRDLPRRLHVHHVDGDYTNNDPSNLQVIDAADHNRLHLAQRGGRRSHAAKA